MLNKFGPWATLIDAGGRPQLSAFWRRRLVMLVPASKTSPVLSRRNLLWLCTAGVLMFILPTVRSVSAAADDQKPAAEAKASTNSAPVADEKTEKKPADAGEEKELEKSSPKPWKMSNGETMWESHGSSGPPIKDEIRKLIAEKKYKFLSVFEDNNGDKQYVYRFNFSDGSNTGMNFSMRLEDVSSWDDYQRKQDEQRQLRHDRINQAIASGKFRLINVEAMQVHLCRDAKSKQEFKVQRIPIRDGKEIALPRGDYGKIPPSVMETSWQEHLELIRQGKRELLELETVNNYTYEMTADDGTKIIFNYGGQEPLKMPEKK
ncbi:MAG: hypothetical protein ABSA16_16245 [Thermoguttaceae bacterium]|jgi:hypothetical protein